MLGLILMVLVIGSFGQAESHSVSTSADGKLNRAFFFGEDDTYGLGLSGYLLDKTHDALLPLDFHSLTYNGPLKDNQDATLSLIGNLTNMTFTIKLETTYDGYVGYVNQMEVSEGGDIYKFSGPLLEFVKADIFEHMCDMRGSIILEGKHRNLTWEMSYMSFIVESKDVRELHQKHKPNEVGIQACW